MSNQIPDPDCAIADKHQEAGVVGTDGTASRPPQFAKFFGTTISQ